MEEERLDSLSPSLDSEWRLRPINLFSVLKSFVYQLRPGQDLTRVSLPTELCYPFSVLEFLALRHLNALHAILELSEEGEPLERFIIALRWYLSHLHEGEAATMTRKPFNPVISEVHHCWVDYQDAHNAPTFAKFADPKAAPESSWTTFIGEQVSHHPPVAAYRIENEAHGIRLDCSAGFQVQFGSNSASVVILGPMIVTTPKEHFILSQSIPNLVVKNVVWGTKYVMYEGTLTLYCPESGYSAELILSESEGQVNTFIGSIFRHKNDQKDIVYSIEGLVGKYGDIYPPNNKQTARRFFDMTKFKEPKVTYLPLKQQLPFESMRVWHGSNIAIVQNDIVTADTEKKKVEAEQRLRIKAMKEAGLMDKGRYFIRNPQLASEEGGHGEGAYQLHPLTLQAINERKTPDLDWVWNSSFNLTQRQNLEEEVVAANEERAKMAEEAQAKAAAEGDAACTIS